MWEAVDFKSARVHAKLSQRAAAQLLGVSQSTISMFEAGKLKFSLERINQLISLILKAQDEHDER